VPAHRGFPGSAASHHEVLENGTNPMVAQLSTELPLPATPAEAIPSRRIKSLIQARDTLQAALRSGELALIGPKNAIFRHLLDNVWYQPRDPKNYGYVHESALGNETIALMAGCSEKTVQRALRELEDDGRISREGRPLPTGGKDPDAIRVTWLLEDEPEGDRESASEGDRESASEGDGESASSTTEEIEEETSSGRDDVIVASLENQAPTAQHPAGADPAPEPDWTGNGQGAIDNRAWLARMLGVPAASIGAPLWRWLESLGLDPDDDFVPVSDAAKRAAMADTPVGYFRSILPGVVAAYHDEMERQEREHRRYDEEHWDGC
jgi:hypothetical protein